VKKLLFILFVTFISIQPAFADSNAIKEQCTADIAKFREVEGNQSLFEKTKSYVNTGAFKDCLDYYASHNRFIRTTGFVMNDVYKFIFNAIGVEFEDRTSDTVAVFTIKTFLLFIFTLLFLISCFSTINLLLKHSKNGIDNSIDYKKATLLIICGFLLVVPLFGVNNGWSVIHYIAGIALIAASYVGTFLYLTTVIVFASLQPNIYHSVGDFISISDQSDNNSRIVATKLVEQHLCDISRREVELNKSYDNSLSFTENKFDSCLKTEELSKPVAGTIYFNDMITQLNINNASTIENRDLYLTLFCSNENDNLSRINSVSTQTQCGSIRFSKTEYATESNINAVNEKARQVASQIRAETCNFTSVDKANPFTCSNLSTGSVVFENGEPNKYKNALPLSKKSFSELVAQIESYNLKISESENKFFDYQIDKLSGDFSKLGFIHWDVLNLIDYSYENQDKANFNDAWNGSSFLSLQDDQTAKLYTTSREFADYLNQKKPDYNFTFKSFVNNTNTPEMIWFAKKYASSLILFSAGTEVVENIYDEKIERQESTKVDQFLSVMLDTVGKLLTLIGIVLFIVGWIIPMLLSLFFLTTFLYIVYRALIFFILCPLFGYSLISAATNNEASKVATDLTRELFSFSLRIATLVIGFIFTLVFSMTFPAMASPIIFGTVKTDVSPTLDLINLAATVLVYYVVLFYFTMKAFNVQKTLQNHLDDLTGMKSVISKQAEEAKEFIFLFVQHPLSKGFTAMKRKSVSAHKKEEE
jgi:hypothetical protein